MYSAIFSYSFFKSPADFIVLILLSVTNFVRTALSIDIFSPRLSPICDKLVVLVLFERFTGFLKSFIRLIESENKRYIKGTLENYLGFVASIVFCSQRLIHQSVTMKEIQSLEMCSILQENPNAILIFLNI